MKNVKKFGLLNHQRGGNGQIEEFFKKYAEDPRRFFNVISTPFYDNEFVSTDRQLYDFLKRIVKDDPEGDLAIATENFRQTNEVSANQIAFKEIRSILVESGFINYHAFQVALANRILRPGSNPKVDKFLLETLDLWLNEEDRLGIELDTRVISFHRSKCKEIDAMLEISEGNIQDQDKNAWRQGVVNSLLWPRGAYIRQSGFQLYSKFANLPEPEPLLIKKYLVEEKKKISISNSEWKSEFQDEIITNQTVTLESFAEKGNDLAVALNFIATNPIDLGYILVYPKLRSVSRINDMYNLDFDISESIQ